MKTHNIYVGILLTGFLFLNSCSKDFLEITPKGTSLEANYYKNEAEAFNGLVAAYDPLGAEVVVDYADKVGLLNTASDDCYAGGGAYGDRLTWEAWNTFTVDPIVGPQADFWGRNFTGINRVNTLLPKIDAVPDMTASKKARFTAECKFLRAYYYFDLVRLFKNVPLFTQLVPPANLFSVTQAKPEETYAQIEKDLNEAIPDLPEVVPTEENGRVTKMAAVALLGKVILFQNDESRMKEAADLFEQVNTSPNYELLPNFGDIFRPDNKFNKESIFEIVHTSLAVGYWGPWPPAGEGNIFTQMCGPRAYVGPTYVAGWGFNPINMDLVNLLKADPRYRYTCANIDSLTKATPGASYQPGYQNTGYFIQKFAPLKEFQATGAGDPVLMYPNDYIEIRLADTYLMEAEALVRANADLGKAQSYLDNVRARVGLASVPATLDNIYKERRLELATEGHRFFDLVRTGKAATALAFKGFTAGKNEILPIPYTELTNTKLVQNPNY
ncbi:MAG: RagB/SusD family nutrient uptake outer membrane protein [Bacteroidetes bacterium]|nr:RagB/SusD family nutrient uptake outer membrane protein [Bacteroidota bacterium]